jgi:hypothetical protein
LLVQLPATSSPLSHLTVGDFELAMVAGGLGKVHWRGIEILRGVNCQLRDENWATFLPQNLSTVLSADTSLPQKMVGQRFGWGDLAAVNLSVEIDLTGNLELEVEVTATRDFLTNRAGLVVLHPIRHVAGTTVTVSHPDNSETEMQFPKLVAPSQPICNFIGLSHHIDGLDVRLTFSGDLFEMEDQRNWSDASFKTYCRPLALPYPFRVAKGEVIRQKMTLKVKAATPFVKMDWPTEDLVTIGQFLKPKKIPEILLAVEEDWLPGSSVTEALMKLGPIGVVVRLYCNETDNGTVLPLMMAAQRISDLVDLEIVLAGGDPSQMLHRIAAEVDAAGVSPRRVFVLPTMWMRSYQPGAAPPFATCETCIAAATAAFPNAQIGAGMMTNFTELNRNRPHPGLGHFVTHGNTAIVHAADDTSVWQTLEALPHIFESGQAIAAGRAYRLGLVSIGMRSNPYGADLVKNPERQKLAMTGEDPRQIKSFAAAYAIGAAVAAATADVEAIALAAPVGRFGIMRCDEPNAVAFPIFHAIRALNQIAGKSVEVLQGLAPGLVGFKASDGSLVVANCSPVNATFQAPAAIAARILDDGDPAVTDPDWLNTASTISGEKFQLASGSCFFAKVVVRL